MARLEIHLLGSFLVTLENNSLTDFESNKARALLAYLAVEANRPHRREVLAGLLWPDTPERTARTNLRSALANLRQVIQDHEEQPPFLKITRQSIQFNQASDAWVDVNLFAEKLSWDGFQGQEDPSDVSAIQEAVELYRGGFLAGFFLPDAPLFEEWALITRESTQRQAVRAMHQLTAYYQESGSHERALQLAQRQVELEPYQEAAHQQVMWSLALNGQRNEALMHYDRFKSLLESELGVAPLEGTQEMYTRLMDGELPGSPTTNLILRREPRLVGACPYQGLAHFQEAEAPFFFGREDFTGRLVSTIQGNPTTMTAIVGSSGSGKSSAIFAGLIPTLRAEQDWLLLDMRPGSQPFQALAMTFVDHLTPGLGEEGRQSEMRVLAKALLAGEAQLSDLVNQLLLKKHTSASRLLLVIDQFEEIYTLDSDTALLHRFLDALLNAVKVGIDGGVHPFVLVLTLRADFMGQALTYRPFADALNESLYLLGPMDQAELRAAIEKPAEGQGAAFEPGLVTRILNDVGVEPGNLPLLEFALTLLWNRLDQGWLTHAAYEEIGGVGGALAQYAEDVYLDLNEDQRKNTRRVLVQLVQPGRGTEDTRRLAARSEFGDEGWRLIQHLADKRLVVTGGDDRGRETVEIIHEALIREWNRLGDWMDADRSFRLWQEDLRATLHQWEDSDRNKGALLHGVSLSKAETWLFERSDDLSQRERWFIQVSIVEQRDRQVAETIRQERERSLQRRLRLFLQALVIVLLLATAVSVGFALVARKEAREAIEAYSLSLSANARQALGDKDATSALVLSLAANRIDKPPLESQRTLLEAAFSPGPRKLYVVDEIFPGVEGPPISLAINPDTPDGAGGSTALT